MLVLLDHDVRVAGTFVMASAYLPAEDRNCGDSVRGQATHDETRDFDVTWLATRGVEVPAQLKGVGRTRLASPSRCLCSAQAER